MTHGTHKVLIGDVRRKLRELADESIHCCVTSPPYWALRAYGTEPQIWGGDPKCEHVWGGESICTQAIGATLGGPKSTLTNWSGSSEAAKAYAEKVHVENVSQGAFCQRCQAWRGELGSEPTSELFIANLVEVFREVRRVLRSDGTAWVNMGDSYAGGAPSLCSGGRNASFVFLSAE